MVDRKENSFELYFAGLARDCEDVLEENTTNILNICEEVSENNCKILIAENDSQDNTREILHRLDKDNNMIELFLFDDLDDEFPIREKRLAYLREFLLKKIQNISIAENSDIPKLYVPIDLDSKIGQSIDTDQFIKECQKVASGETDAIFPASKPYYYDIYALRAEGWVEEDYQNKVQKSRKQRGLFISKVNFKYSKQKHISDLKEKSSISVQSAFGGVGIYNLQKLNDASYKRDDVYPQNVCEHTIFNKSLKSKEISTDFVIQAPRQHIRFKTSNIEKIKVLIISTLSDIKWLLVG